MLMKNNKNKIKQFMKLKNKVIDNLQIKDGIYYNDKDEKIINNWKEEDCEEIWKFIKEKIKEGYKGLGNETCPFCVKKIIENLYTKFFDRSLCGKKNICEYSKNHGNCYMYNSDYKKYSDFVYHFFINDFYKNMIKEIEND